MDNVKYTFAKTEGDLIKLQDKAIRAANSARKHVQVALVATVQHLGIHHDVRLATRLVEGLQDTIRGDAMVRYLCEFGHLQIVEVEHENPETGKVTKVKQFAPIGKGKADEHREQVKGSFDECKSTMWWEFTPPRPFKGFDAERTLRNFLSQAAKAQEKIEAGENLAEGAEVTMAVSDDTMREVLKMCGFKAELLAA